MICYGSRLWFTLSVILALFLDGRYLSVEDADFVQLVTSDIAFYLKTANINK